MADKVVVKHGKDGKVTVCIGDRCVTVSCPEVEEDPDSPEVEVGEPKVRIESVTNVFDDLEAHDWVKKPSGVETARSDDGAHLSRRPLA